MPKFLAKKGVAQLSHPLYSPDLSFPPQLFCFPKIKNGAERRPLCFDRRHLEICNYEIKSFPNFSLHASYEMTRRSHQRVYSSVRRLHQLNITYLNFLHVSSLFSLCCHKTYRVHLVYQPIRVWQS